MGIHGLRALIEPRFGPLSPALARLRSRAWLAFLVAGLGLGLGAALVNDEVALQPLLTAMGLVASVAILVGVRINQPARPLPWQLLAICTALTTIGVVITLAGGTLGLVGQLLTAAGSIAGVVGFALLVRGRIPGGDRGALLDAAIVASGIGVVIWAFGFAPYVLAARQSSLVAAAFFYPALIALAMVTRMWFLGGAHRPATRLIVLVVLASNGIIALDVLRGVVGGEAFIGPTLFVRFAELAFVGAAALQPSMAIAPERQRAELRPISRRRIMVLTAALLVNPATLAIQVLDNRQLDPAPYLIGGVVIGLLVIARLGDALRQLGESLHERESLMELLRRQALYDALTLLPNRSLFTERLAADLAGRSPDGILAVLLVDLDDFKAVNDSYGHEAGDALLVAAGQRLRAVIRDGDTAARLGGDEFVIALPSCADALVPARVAQRVLAVLTEPFDIAGRRLVVGASVGVAVAGANDRTVDDLVRNADVAMYLAKSRGKGRVEVFEPAMHVASLTQLQLRTDLAKGLADRELRLLYQPIYDLRTGRTIGYEALVRWLRDGLLIGPGEFIPMAESSGLIGPLTDWVIEEACRAAAGWARSGNRQWVSVNVSSTQLLRNDLPGRLRRTLDSTGLAPDRLVLEITESSLLEINVARPAIERLSEIGLRLAIDDFGTGYSALSYLAHLPIDIVKIDRSFVIALQQEGPEQAVAAAIIALARRLGLTTIGEEIETSAQLDQLAGLGCDLGQGFYLGRPIPNDDLRPALLAPGLRPRLTRQSLIA